MPSSGASQVGSYRRVEIVNYEGALQWKSEWRGELYRKWVENLSGKEVDLRACTVARVADLAFVKVPKMASQPGTFPECVRIGMVGEKGEYWIPIRYDPLKQIVETYGRPTVRAERPIPRKLIEHPRRFEKTYHVLPFSFLNRIFQRNPQVLPLPGAGNSNALSAGGTMPPFALLWAKQLVASMQEFPRQVLINGLGGCFSEALESADRLVVDCPASLKYIGISFAPWVQYEPLRIESLSKQRPGKEAYHREDFLRIHVPNVDNSKAIRRAGDRS